MGGSAGVARSTANSYITEASAFMASLTHYMSNDHPQNDRRKQQTHIVDISICSPTDIKPVQCGDIIEFKVKGFGEYDIIQVDKNDDNYYRVPNGPELLKVNARTPIIGRCIPVPFDIGENDYIYMYFCVIQSSKKVLEKGKFPKEYCQLNRFKVIKKAVKQVSLTDKKTNFKFYFNKGDTIEVIWSSKCNMHYYIEEKMYCPASGGLYTPKKTSLTTSSKGKYTKKFDEFGVFFLFRLNDTHQIHDIIVCVVNGKYHIKYIKITDYNISSNIIWIEQDDWILFEWNTKYRPSTLFVDRYRFHPNQQHRSIESRSVTIDCDYMYYQFTKIGVYTYKTENNPIGTIIVKPKKTILPITISQNDLIHKINTNHFVEFIWKKSDSKDPILITVDSDSSVTPTRNNDLTQVFGCSTHQCRRIEPFFRRYFEKFETCIFNIPHHGLYNISYCNNPDNALISLVVEKDVDIHKIRYDEDNEFKSRTIQIHRNDNVLFRSSSERRTNKIYQTDEYGNRLESEELLPLPQENGLNYFMNFSQIGLFYFSMNVKNRDEQSSANLLAILVLPNIRFHYKPVTKVVFDDKRIKRANKNDFIIWEFSKAVCHDVVRLHSEETFQHLLSCHSEAKAGKYRQCLAVNSKYSPTGVSYFCNPDFERVTESYEDRLISTIIIDPLFSEKSFFVTNEGFQPDSLYIAENDTVSWIFENAALNHEISIQSNNNEDICSNRNIGEFVDGVYHLHTFNRPGQYTIKSNYCRNTATVFVYSTDDIHGRNREVEEPETNEEIESVTQLYTRIKLNCPNDRNARIHYTLDGSIPTQRFNAVHPYNPREGVRFWQPGLYLLRAYSTEAQRLPSSIATYGPTFVMETGEVLMENRQSDGESKEDKPSWNTCKVILTASLEYPNEIHGQIEIRPSHSFELIDHFQLYINNTATQKTTTSLKFRYSATDFADAEHFEINVVAFPKHTGAQPIPSNKIPLKIERAITNGGNSDSSNDFKRRAEELLKRLAQDLDNRSKGSNTICNNHSGRCCTPPQHPHRSYPGIRHYIDNGVASQKSSIPCCGPSRHENSSMHLFRPADNSHLFSTEIAVSIENKEY